ncbi:MAG: hypothetical protein WED15_05590 [Akkermansiaceae bacterium]
MGSLDMILFLVAVVGVIAFGIWQGKKETAGAAESGGAAGYFLAGRGLTWWLVGFSLIAANISTFPPNSLSECPGSRPTGWAWRLPPMNGWRLSLWW